MTRRFAGGMTFAACALAMVPLGLAAQDPRRELPRVSMAPLTGKDSFDRYCANCHGIGGRGDGPVAASLKATPPDLTTLTSRHGGDFPRAQVRDFVEGTGRSLAAHGPTQMPFWGSIFRWLESPARTDVRITNLVAYVESLQTAPAATEKSQAPISGRELFQTFCAPCHGASGSGDGPMAAQLRVLPPDLRKLQQKNGGRFPGPQVERIIDGQRVDAHGTREMPVWGDVFVREAGGGRVVAKARIDALIEYLRSIQERPAE
jgi:mono/diheme cytochrome c family protein